MAILIPSKNMYDKQNPKVRDNVVERIEVSAIDVVSNNEYEVLVYSEKNTYEQNDLTIEDYGSKSYLIKETPNTGAYVITYIPHYDVAVFYYYDINIKIPFLKNNSYLSKIYINEEEKKELNPKHILYGKKIVTKMTAFASNVSSDTPSISNIVYGEVSESENAIIELPKISDYSIDGIYIGFPVKDNSELILTRNENEETYILSGKILVGLKYERLSGQQTISSLLEPKDMDISGEQTFFQTQQIEITVYGDTIGIDLADKTVYINGETAKKVFSANGNELMQTANYYSDDGGATQENAIEKAFTETQNGYAIGKETATIRCDISDYYEYNATADNYKGNKVIAIDNSTEKMSFNLYDKVIPMVYGADGKDHPMSLNKDGSPKVFEVLGSKIYYDGAIWQEISLQET